MLQEEKNNPNQHREASALHLMNHPTARRFWRRVLADEYGLSHDAEILPYPVDNSFVQIVLPCYALGVN
jgi:hypothetical protein